jgi:GH25 family lysozyme M1 (1,4-beta-N-acetylmuramidase)
MKKLIDISRYQSTPDFSKVKDAVNGVIVQIGYGNAIKYPNQIDPQFERSYSKCKEYNIPIGGYWYSYARTVDQARDEANSCIRAISGKKFEYPIYIDLEEGLNQFSKAQLSNIATTFCQILEKAGYFAGIYMSRSPAQNLLSDQCIKNYTLWLAEYGSRLNWNGPVGIWQYTSDGRVPGISGAVDLNNCYEDFPTLIKNAGLNGYTKPPANTLDVDGFKQGDRGDGVLAYKQLLIIAHNVGIINQKVDNNSSFGEGTKKATNEFLNLIGKNQNGIAGANTIVRLGGVVKEYILSHNHKEESK